MPSASVVTLRGYPVVLGLRLQEHYEAVVRECQLLAAPRTDAAQPLPDRLLNWRWRWPSGTPTAVRPGAPRPAPAGRRGARPRVVDLTYTVTPEQMAAAEAGIYSWTTWTSSRAAATCSPRIRRRWPGCAAGRCASSSAERAGASPVPWDPAAEVR